MLRTAVYFWKNHFDDQPKIKDEVMADYPSRCLNMFDLSFCYYADFEEGVYKHVRARSGGSFCFDSSMLKWIAKDRGLDVDVQEFIAFLKKRFPDRELFVK